MVMSSEKIVNPLIWLFFVSFYVFSVIDKSLTESSVVALSLIALPVLGTLVISAFSQSGKMRIQLSVMSAYLLIFMMFCYSSSLWALEPLYAIQKGNTLLIILVSFVVFDVCLPEINRTRFILQAIMWGGYMIVMFALSRYGWSYISATLSENTRVSNDVLNANTLGLNAAFSILLCMFFIVDEGPTPKNILSACFAGISFIALAASGSRKALLIILIGVSLFFLLRSASQEKRLLNIAIKVVFVSVVLALIFAFLSRMEILQGSMMRIRSLLDAFEHTGRGDSSMVARLRLIEIGVELFKKRPLLGFGIDNACLFTTEFGHDRYYLHNNFVELLADGGIAGFLAYYWIYAYLIIKFWKNRDFQWHNFNYCLILMVIRLIMDYGMIAYDAETSYFYIFAFVSLLEEMKRKKRFTFESWLLNYADRRERICV